MLPPTEPSLQPQIHFSREKRYTPILAQNFYCSQATLPPACCVPITYTRRLTATWAPRASSSSHTHRIKIRINLGAGEMGQLLRACTVLPKDPCLVPSTHIRLLTLAVIPAPAPGVFNASGFHCHLHSHMPAWTP